jgi:hypothetical protein
MDSTHIMMIARSVRDSYNDGILALGTVTMAGITINLTVLGDTDWNRLEITGNNKIATVAIYDNDSEDAQFATILDIVSFILR